VSVTSPKHAHNPERNSRLAFVPGVCLILVLTTLFWFPALVWHQTVIHTDNSTIDIPFIDFFARMIRGQVSPVWSDKIYGGHPLFAESQGGFAHPLNIVWAAIVTPLVGTIYSLNLFYWLLMNIGGIGMIGLCRLLGASTWASAFAALAVVFSPIWANELYVLPVFHTLVWIPWSLWAMENWLKRPTAQSASLFGAAGALVCLAGYPQGLHGMIIFVLARLLVIPFQPDMRREWAASWRLRTASAVVAVGIGAGLASVQLLPLFELTGQSHRSEGIGILFAGSIPLTSYFRGLLVTSYGSDRFFYFPGVGSLLVCVLASSAFIFPVPARIKGYMVAVLVMLVLGMERATPLFRFVYDNNLLPGLSYFRTAVFYLALAAIGIAILAAFAIDGLVRWLAQWRETPPAERTQSSIAKIIGLLLLTLFWSWALFSLGPSRPLAVQIGIISVVGAAIVGILRCHRQDLLGPFFAIIVAIECIALRLHPFRFFDPDVLAKPAAITAIQAARNWQEYKTTTLSLAVLFTLEPPRSPELGSRVRRMVAAISPMTNLAFDLPMMNGNLALMLRRRSAVEDLLQDEIRGGVATPPGLRLIDLLAVRFVTHDSRIDTAGFRPVHFDERNQIWTMENEAALPRFQIYARHQTVDSLEAALNGVKNLKNRTLVIENLDPALGMDVPNGGDDGSTDAGPPAHFKVLKAGSTKYLLRVSASKPAWLFLADANYPGWTASIDDNEVPVFSAQVLGKAIAIPPGTHSVTIEFRSMSFRYGLVITFLTLGLLVVLWGWSFAQQRRQRA
jgi:hypothetical protein